MAAHGFFVLVGQDGARWPLGPEPIIIGRTADSTIQLTDLRVSRTHAYLWRARGRCWVRDAKTTHGTYVDEERLNGERELRLGEHVRIADYTLRLALASELDSNKGSLASFRERLSRRRVLLIALVAVVVLLLVILALFRPWQAFPSAEDLDCGQGMAKVVDGAEGARLAAATMAWGQAGPAHWVVSHPWDAAVPEEKGSGPAVDALVAPARTETVAPPA